jgi:hypothetical protein
MEHSMDHILSAFRVLSDRSFSCAGEVIETRGDSLVTALQECLYRLCYTNRFTGTYRPGPPRSDADPGLVSQLQNANAGHTLYHQGWWIEQTHESGRVLASRSGVSRWFLPGHYLTDKGPGFITKNDRPAVIYMPRDSTAEQLSFYMAFGETISDDQEHGDQLRFYWNVSAAGAPRLMAMLTRELNRFAVPYLFKSGNRLHMYDRSDVAVLYVHRRYYGITSRIVAGMYPQIAGFLKPDTPLFARRLADGLGLAEDPPDGKSFGANRCTIVAETLRACYEQNLETVEERRAELERQFRQRGLDPQRLYLNPGHQDVYEFPPPPMDAPL